MARLGPALLALILVGCSVPERGPGLLAVLAERDVEGLDPHTAGQVWQTQMVLANLYEGLVAVDPNMSLRPGLATSWTNPDDTTWVFEIRRGVAFHQGGELSPEDVVSSLERARDHPRSVLRVALAGVQEIRALPGSRVRLRTREPDASLAARLVEVPILSRDFLAKRGEGALATTSGGTGAYRLSGRVPGLHVEMERFAAYWGGKPALPRVRFVARPFDAGDLSAAVPPGAHLLFWTRPGPRSGGPDPGRFQRHESPGLAVLYLSFDLRGPSTPGVTLRPGQQGNPFLHVGVRRAVARAVRTGLFRALAGREEGRPIHQLVPSFVFGFDPEIEAQPPEEPTPRALLEGTPYREGFDVDLDLREIHAWLGPPLAEALEAAGIGMRPRPRSEADFFRRVGEGRSSLAVLRFSCWTGDAQTIFDKVVHSRRPEAGYGIFNFSFDQGEVAGLDADIEAARRELSPRRRLTLLQAVSRKVAEAGLLVPLLQENHVAFSSRELAWRPRSDTFILAREVGLRP